MPYTVPLIFNCEVECCTINTSTPGAAHSNVACGTLTLRKNRRLSTITGQRNNSPRNPKLIPQKCFLHIFLPTDSFDTSLHHSGQDSASKPVEIHFLEGIFMGWGGGVNCWLLVALCCIISHQEKQNRAPSQRSQRGFQVWSVY